MTTETLTRWRLILGGDDADVGQQRLGVLALQCLLEGANGTVVVALLELRYSERSCHVEVAVLLLE